MMTVKTRRGRWAPIVVVPALLLAVAGCSDDGDGEAEGGSSETATESTAPSPTEAATTGISPPDLPELPRVGQAAGAVADVDWDQSTCGTTPGEQSVSGTVTNPTDQPVGYVIQINWTNATSDVLASDFATVRGAQPEQEEEWEVTAEVPEGVTQCTIFAQRGSLPRP